MTGSKVKTYQLAVIGGGISGIGAALAAAEQGINAILVEKGRCCEATSDNSLRIIHGGLRYLQHLNLPRVFRSIKDQSYWLREGAKFIKPLRCMLPLKPTGFKSKLPLAMAGALYSAFYRSISASGSEAHVIEPKEAKAFLPALASEFDHGAFLWQDALLVDPKGFTSFLLAKIRAGGVEVVEGQPIESIARSASGFIIEPNGVQAGSVINTAGPWLGSFDLSNIERKKKFPAGWCKAFNLILRRPSFDFAYGLYGKLGRVFFFVPREQQTVLGTWYEPLESRPEEGCPNGAEIRRFIDSVNESVPETAVQADEVVGVEWGILPMQGVDRQGPVLYGTHRFHQDGRYIEVLSTKYTTFRSQGREAVKLAMR